MSSEPINLEPLWLSLRVAVAATALLLPAGTLIAWWISHTRSKRIKSIVETVLLLPLILPPTVIGYLLLLLLGNGTSVGHWLNESVGIRLLFTWQGASIAAAVMAFPLYTRTASVAFSAIDPELLDVGRMFGAGEWELARMVLLPMAARGLLSGLALGFARAMGEFGATLIIAGSIPGRTRTLPLALYNAIETGSQREALTYTLILTVIALGMATLFGAYDRALGGERRT